MFDVRPPSPFFSHKPANHANPPEACKEVKPRMGRELLDSFLSSLFVVSVQCHPISPISVSRTVDFPGVSGILSPACVRDFFGPKKGNSPPALPRWRTRGTRLRAAPAMARQAEERKNREEIA